MQKLLGLFVLFLFFGMGARAQEIPEQEAPKPEAPKTTKKKQKPVVPTPKFEVGLGFTYRRFDAPSGGKFGLSGGTGEFVYNRYRWLSLVGDLTATYRSENVQGYNSIYSYMLGPRVYFLGHRHRLTPYGQFLYGGGTQVLSLPLNGGFPATTRTSTATAYAGGGGIEYRYRKHWSFRLFEFDYEKTHFNDILFKTAGDSEGNYRLSAGFVYRWGERKDKKK